MLSECIRAIRHNSESHIRGASPFAMRCVLIRSKARRSRLETLKLAEDDAAPRAGPVIETGSTIRGRVGTLPRAGPEAVIRRATGRLEPDCPKAVAQFITIKANDRVQRRRADCAVHSTIVRGY